MSKSKSNNKSFLLSKNKTDLGHSMCLLTTPDTVIEGGPGNRGGCPIHSRTLRMSGRCVLLSSVNISTGRALISSGHS